MSSNVSHFSFPTDITFGPGCRHTLKDYVSACSEGNVLVVIDPGIVDLPVFSDWLGQLRQHWPKLGVFTDFPANPQEGSVIRGVQAFKDCEAVAMVAIGGGVALDVAKAVALMVNHPGSVFDYEDGIANPPPVDQDIPYLVAVPTTAGTGSEVGRSTVIADADHRKRVIFSPRLLPKKVFVDAELTVGLPASITAATGMDALTHCVEAYLARGYHPLCDAIALHGVRLIAKSLKTAVLEGGNLDARGDMLVAAMMGAIAFQKGLGVNHSLAHALSQICGTHHGLANALFLPASLRFNGQQEPERLRDLARAVGLEPQAEAFIDWVRQLRSEIKLPSTLKEAGIQASELPKIAEAAMQDGCHSCNPRPCQLSDMSALIESSSGH